MATLLIMAVGILVGLTVFPKKLHTANNLFQPIITVILIFLMGVSLGAREGFFDSLGRLGFESLVFCLLPVAFSVILVFVLSKIFLKAKNQSKENKK